MAEHMASSATKQQGGLLCAGQSGARCPEAWNMGGKHVGTLVGCNAAGFSLASDALPSILYAILNTGRRARMNDAAASSGPDFTSA